jgi:hypothetical protein
MGFSSGNLSRVITKAGSIVNELVGKLDEENLTGYLK